MRRIIARAFLAATVASLAATGPDAAAQDGGTAYSLAADAAALFVFGGASLDPAEQSASWKLEANLLHRLDGEGWGAVLNQSLDLTSSATGGVAATAHEAYARLDLGDSGQLFVGKRRLPLGLGTFFAPGDALNPRTGFWDQKNGFRGLAFAGSIGSELGLRAALSLERNLAWASADPELLAWALSADLQLGSLQVAASGVWSPGESLRPSLALGCEFAGLVAQAEFAAELEGGPDYYGTAGLRYAADSGFASLVLSLDYGYNGSPGRLFKGTHYAVGSASFSVAERLSATARALVEPEGPSAIASFALALYPAPGLDLEGSLQAGLGEDGSELSRFALGSGTLLRVAWVFAVRVHF